MRFLTKLTKGLNWNLVKKTLKNHEMRMRQRKTNMRKRWKTDEMRMRWIKTHMRMRWRKTHMRMRLKAQNEISYEPSQQYEMLKRFIIEAQVRHWGARVFKCTQ